MSDVSESTQSNNNVFFRNNITEIVFSGVKSSVESNIFYKNNMLLDADNLYIFPLPNKHNFWDNGSVGNYWSDYAERYPNASEIGNTGVGDTPYVIDAANQDRYPLMNMWHPTIPFDTVPPRITVVSPGNTVYNESSIQLVFSICEPASSMSFSLDGQENFAIAGNATLGELPNGSHNLTVYVTDQSGNTGFSETIYFTVDVPEPFPTTLIVASVITVAVYSIGLLVYFKKRQKARDKA